MKRANKNLIDFFEMQESDEKNRLLEAYIAEAEKQIGFNTIMPDDEIRFVREGSEELPGTLKTFASVLYDKIMTGVCNVIASS